MASPGSHMKGIEIDPAVQFTWALANAEACLSGEDRIRPAHFFLAILNIFDDAFRNDAEQMGLPEVGIESLLEFAAHGIANLGSDAEAITAARRKLRETLREHRPARPLCMLHRADESRTLFKNAAARALAGKAAGLEMRHLWMELLANPPREVAGCFPEAGVYKDDAYWSSSGSAQWQIVDDAPPRHGGVRTPVVDRLGRDLTGLARQGKLPKVVGRKAEMRAIARYLLRTNKRGVTLVGDAGVGKTAIVEGLAQRVMAADAPDAVRSMRIVQINVADLISGTKYRGDMEQRLQALIAEAEADPDLVLFIDEVHLVMQAGAGNSPLDIANMLKPALARDSLRCIGATTTEEFERHVRPDAAFMRRFQVLRVARPSAEEMIEVAQAWARRIERIQGVQFATDAVDRAIRLAGSLITDRSLPDSAIDLLENAAAFSKVSSLTSVHTAPRKSGHRITASLIDEVLEEVHGISVQRLSMFDCAKVGTALREEILGQERAIAQIIDTLQTKRLMHQCKSQPVAVLLFAGPTGVGKSHTAKHLAAALFRAERTPFAQFNMSECKERHELARIIGAPPGFIGHSEEPALFRFIRANPQGLILLDEMEKAHPEIQDYFLQIFDTGFARDSHGRAADFRNVIFVMTCNVSGSLGKRAIGFVQGSDPGPEDQPDGALNRELGAYFRPEFLARIDRKILFRTPDHVDLAKLFRRQFFAVAEGLRGNAGIRVALDDEALEQICRHCTVSSDGVRGFLRAAEREVFVPLLRLAESGQAPGSFRVVFVDGSVVFAPIGGDAEDLASCAPKNACTVTPHNEGPTDG